MPASLDAKHAILPKNKPNPYLAGMLLFAFPDYESPTTAIQWSLDEALLPIRHIVYQTIFAIQNWSSSRHVHKPSNRRLGW
jgi:hypothetical protein